MFGKKPALKRRKFSFHSCWPEAGDAEGRICDCLLWRPAPEGRTAPQGKSPLLIYSHGQYGQAGEADYLCASLAAQGWVVAAPEHRDREAQALRRGAGGRRGFQHGAWAYRTQDLRRLLDHLLQTGSPLAGQIDAGRIAAAGFSLGGYSALTLGGILPESLERRIQALALLSPAVFMFEDNAFRRVTLPTLSLYGQKERDVQRQGLSRAEKARRIQSRLEKGKALLLEIRRARHLSFIQRRRAAFLDRLPGPAGIHRTIQTYVAAFLGHFVIGLPNQLLAAKDDGRISLYRN